MREELLRAEVLASQLENASDYTTILQTLATDINTLAAITPVRKTAPTPIGI